NAEWWSSGQIPDSAFVSGIQWLISNNIIVIPSTEQDAGTEASVIPDWIKNNAGWWSSGQIPDSAFVSGLQWLITNGIMTIS
ncbi:MAG TPA: peptidase, partial [Candidatus Nitrosopelagicus sp.]|nr:peptidase [Candidatus Nitrosopelagicus sp.]